MPLQRLLRLGLLVLLGVASADDEGAPRAPELEGSRASLERPQGASAEGPGWYVWQETRAETEDWLRELRVRSR